MASTAVSDCAADTLNSTCMIHEQPLLPAVPSCKQSIASLDPLVYTGMACMATAHSMWHTLQTCGVGPLEVNINSSPKKASCSQPAPILVTNLTYLTTNVNSMHVMLMIEE